MGGWGPGCVYGSHRDEKVPSRSASGLPVPGGRCREAGRGNPPPHHHPGGPPNEPRPHSAPPQLPHRPDPLGPGDGEGDPWRGKAGIRGGGSHRPPGGPHPPGGPGGGDGGVESCEDQAIKNAGSAPDLERQTLPQCEPHVKRPEMHRGFRGAWEREGIFYFGMPLASCGELWYSDFVGIWHGL